MSTAQDLPLRDEAPGYGAPTLCLVPAEPLDFDEAVRRIRPRLQRYAVRRLGDAHESEELVQEALLRAYTHRGQLRTEDDLAAWTTVVTGRLVIDRLRVRGRSTSVAEVPETGRVGRDTADVVVARDEARTALDALDAMPTRQASLLWAREVEGQSYQDLCVRFAMTEPAVRSVLTRARKALRKEYGLRGGTLPVGGLAALAPWLEGLTWADKLRRVTSRLTAPAALGAVGITTLGGLILSPFGASPAPGSATFTPAQAVVVSTTTSEARDARLASARVPTPGKPAAARPTDTTTATGTDLRRPAGGNGALRRIQDLKPCSEDGASVTPAGAGLPTGTVGSGGSECNPADRVSVAELPDNPTGYKTLSVQSNDVHCEHVQPVTRLTSVTCTQGASR